MIGMNTNKNIKPLPVKQILIDLWQLILIKIVLNLEKIKHYLNEKGVGFTYRIRKDETQLIFEAKNKALVRSALDQVIEEITKKPEAFVKRVLKKPHEMKPQEKIAYYKKHIQYKGMMPAVTKDIGKERAK